jgi:hypothetical protein
MLLPLAFGGLSCSHKHTLTTTSVVIALALSSFVFWRSYRCCFAVLMRDLHNVRMEQRSSSFTVFFFWGGDVAHRLKLKKNITLKKGDCESYAIVKASYY